MSGKRAKYEITEIAHPEYPFLHRIRALQPVGTEVRPGDLGGFVEHEGNLSNSPEDAAWVYDDAIACNDAYLDQGATLRERAVACERAYLSDHTRLSGAARAEGDAYLRGAVVRDRARVSGTLLDRPKEGGYPEVCGESVVYGTVSGPVRIGGNSIVFAGERFCNDTRDTWTIQDGRRTVERNPDRDALRPLGQAMKQSKPKRREKTAHER